MPIHADRSSVVRSFCRTCSNGCAVLVELSESGHAVRLTGDPDNPVYAGYTCPKGRAQPELAAAPSRLLTSMRRAPDGSYAAVSSRQAIKEIAQRLRTIVDRYGPSAVAIYQGTSAHANSAAPAAAQGFLSGLGSSLFFTTNTIDKGGRNVAQALHGSWQAPRQGWDRPEVALLLGINPFVSYKGFPSGMPTRWLAENRARGMKLIVVDPRRTDVARRADRHLQARPGTDVHILAAMISIILAEHLHDRDFVRRHTTGVDALRRAVSPFTPQYAAAAADIAVEDLVWSARTFAAAKRGYAVGGTGPQMTTNGVVIEYLLLCLETLCGHYLRAGEIVRNAGTLFPAHLSAKAQASPPRSAFLPQPEFRVRNLRTTVAGPPTAALPDEVLREGPGQIRALISLSGNPVAAIPGKSKVVAAMRKLDLLVQIDPWMSETARLATYVVAPTVWLESAGITLVQDYSTSMAPAYGYGDSYAQYAPPAADPPAGADVIEEWKFFYELAKEMGIQPALAGRMVGTASRIELDLSPPPTSDDVLALLSRSGRVSLADVKQHDGGALFPEPAVHVAPQDPGWTGRLEFADSSMLTALAGFARPDPPGEHVPPFRLVPRRAHHVHNSSCNVQATNRGRPYNPAFLAPDDAARLGLSAGDLIEIWNGNGAIIAVAEIDPGLRNGVVSMSHCFGDLDLAAERAAPLRNGAATNWLTSNDEAYDAYTGQPLMSNVPVDVRRAACSPESGPVPGHVPSRRRRGA
jgi:anaerobic selenocysteine-containing dehydrogenase